MSKKCLNIHKRKDGRWEGRFSTGVYENGKTRYTSVYAPSYNEVKEKLVEAMAKATYVQSKIKESRFSEILQLWLRNNRLRQKGATEHKYRTMIEKHIEPGLGAYKVSQITASVINLFLEKKQRTGRLDKKGGLSPSYVRSMALIIQSAMAFASSEGFCQPLKSPICKPMPEKTELEVLCKEDQKKLETFMNEKIDPTYIGIYITLYAGLRIGEVCALSWEDIDLDAKVIHIRHTIARVRNSDSKVKSWTKLILDTPKTGASIRDIPISSLLFTRLAKINDEQKTGYVLSGSFSFLSPRTYEYRFHKTLEECGIKQFNYHVLRHTFATRCIEAGVDVKSLSEMLGHSNVAITLSTYVHSSMEMKRKQLEKLNLWG